MFKNPFTPLFGGRPDVFFGRDRILRSFTQALATPGSDYRSLFITGTRGFGKTALLEQLSLRGSANGWDVIDVNAENALQSMFRRLARFDEVETTTDPRVEVKVLSTGASLGGHGVRKTTHYTVDDLDILLVSACEKAKAGVLVTVDEVQKVSLDDVSRICGAFQMASRKGCDAILAVAGLPYAYESVTQHDGCTYMRRAVHEELGLFTPEEVSDAFAEAFSRIKGLSLSDEAMKLLVERSSGHPYMMQLLGYAVVNYANENSDGKHCEVSVRDVEACSREALQIYDDRALAPIMSALTPRERDYLEAAADCLGDNLHASTGDIARALGKSQGQLSHVRESLVRSGILVVPARGEVRFGIPFLRQYLGKKTSGHRSNELLDEWGV